MKRLREFLRLPNMERRLLLKAALLLEAIKLGVRLLPFLTLRRLLARAADVHPRGLRRVERCNFSADRVTWAVETASRHTPGVKTCLAQALAAQVLLARHGHPALVRIGVVRGEGGEFQAHAWVESEGAVVIGEAEFERYTPLAGLEKET